MTQERGDQPGQAVEPVVARGGVVGEAAAACGEDRSQRDTGPARHRLPHCVHRTGDAPRQVAAERWQGVCLHLQAALGRRRPPAAHPEGRSPQPAYNGLYMVVFVYCTVIVETTVENRVKSVCSIIVFKN